MDNATIPETAPETPSAPEPVETVSAPEPPRKRGRPPGSKNKVNTAQPETAQPISGDAPKRGRPRKISAEPAEPLRIGADTVKGLHLMAAHATGLPELQLSDSEAAMLANAIEAVGREYAVVLSGKAAATAQLVIACLVIYGPRLALVRKRRIMAAEGRAAAETAASTADLPLQ